MAQFRCPTSKDPKRIIKDTHDSIDPKNYTYYPCPGPADPERAWLCEECQAAKVAELVAA